MSVIVVDPKGKEYPVPYDVQSKVSVICDRVRELASIPPSADLSLRRGETPISPYALVTALGLADGEKLNLVLARAVVGNHDPHRRTLPKRTDIDPSEIKDPDDFDQLVTKLLELNLQSVTVDDCKEALRSAMFDTDRASEYLLALDGQAAPLATPKLALTPAELEACREIKAETNETLEIVIQLFMICDKDKAATVRLIRQGTG
jgi:hypothetical protein